MIYVYNDNDFNKSEFFWKAPEKECEWEISWILYSHFYAAAVVVVVDL